jgi:phosphatidylserine/phosphatidylglycerophosphate/cardiolipin synthase-like enzyme
MLRTRFIGLLFACAGAPAIALQAPPVTPFAGTGTVQYAFTPGDRVDAMLIAAIDAARRQILVQAYSFTHRRIADALVRAQRRGIEVAVIIDAEQARSEPSIVRELSHGNVVLRFDHHHAAAHNKTMVIDSGLDDCVVMTGSFNFTTAAQQRNAENALLLRGNPPLCEAYYGNWRRHYAHTTTRL